MADRMTLAQTIKQRYLERSGATFPTTDIKTLVSDDRSAFSLLHGRIEMFLSAVAGYASSADRLGRRSADELQKAREFLSQSFFDRYPEYGTLREKVTPQGTPLLFAEMSAAEENRVELLAEVNSILGALEPG